MIATAPIAKLHSKVAPARLASTRKTLAVAGQKTTLRTGFLAILLKALSAWGT
jgi:hypothetical protein